ncbi:n-glycosylase/DNA lyase-like protein [Chytridium lagenaria]|nr:n-glycosylase/DNA lyase-like protein [Chytridium lagenaria]
MIPIPPRWWSLRTPPKELRLDATLFSGQSFLWRQTAPNEYTSVLQGHIVTLKQTDNDILDYFRLDVKLEQLYQEWANDKNFKKKCMGFEGVRLLRQDPIENLITFICTSNNNISRITQMIDKLCIHYGSYIGDYSTSSFYSFPPLESLCTDTVEKTLRDLGFGGGREWLATLRQRSYEEARGDLLELCGVGPKVADCILLMSLDKLDAVPVDTHVWQIATRDYGYSPKSSADVFRKRFGPYAGWAHSVLFKAEIAKGKKSGDEVLKPSGRKDWNR